MLLDDVRQEKSDSKLRFGSMATMNGCSFGRHDRPLARRSLRGVSLMAVLALKLLTRLMAVRSGRETAQPARRLGSPSTRRSPAVRRVDFPHRRIPMPTPLQLSTSCGARSGRGARF